MASAQYAQALRIVEKFNNKYIKPVQYAYFNGYAEQSGGLMDRDLLEEQSIRNFRIQYDRGLTSLPYPLLHLIEDASDNPAFSCGATKALETVEAAATTPLILSRIGDAVSAIYIPEHIHHFKFYICDPKTKSKTVCVYDESAIEDKTLRQLLSEETSQCIGMGTHERVALFKELEYERMHNYHQSKLRVRLSEKLSIEGQEYKRIELGYPFLPMISLYFADVTLEFFEKCIIRIEYVYLDFAARRALSECQVSRIQPLVDQNDPVVEGAIPLLLPGMLCEVWLGRIRVLDCKFGKMGAFELLQGYGTERGDFVEYRKSPDK